MTARPLTRPRSLDARAFALTERKRRLDAEIDAEMARPLPCTLRLGRMKRAKLRLKDELSLLDGVMATLHRATSVARPA
ncbi:MULTISPECIES: YdcH family protein [unclassified Roseivivax]|uniref:YdcH family protein n=1 Tax=Roseivivax sp. GX 12232 TaxID=2900547 RepID=UPI001E439658|nr:YdcH family protein [Roseivivax sp. GX 12232]MCE0505402.1 YdcH family protein [Roseivivax sp. GX 12232]